LSSFSSRSSARYVASFLGRVLAQFGVEFP
jgi:hypothetical protein